MFFRLARSSLQNRRGAALLSLLAITISVYVLLGVEQLRHHAKSSFGNTVSGIDLIVGPRTGDINLLLYSVFRLGNATSNISWESYQNIASDPAVSWTIPLSLGDSHKGYRVMGTSGDYFRHFHYGQGRPLAFASGAPFAGPFDVVLGSAVAKSLGYQLGNQLVLAHGLGSTSFSQHDDKPFRVVGILKPTGTPVDQTLHISLEGMEAIHVDWDHGVKAPGHSTTRDELHHRDLTPENITAFMVGLESRLSTFQLQRKINNYQPEPLLAILPGVTLTELWHMMAVLENTLRLISALVLLASLLGLSATLLASIRERRREIAVMRAVGASPWFLFALIEAEAALVALAGSLLATALLFTSVAISKDLLAEHFSLFIEGPLLTAQSLDYLLLVVSGALLVALVPGISAYRTALHQQLND